VVVIRIWPSPGNFAESIQPTWFDPNARTSDRTLLVNPGQRPGGWSQCGNDERFRTVDDVGDEILAIQRYVDARGWLVFGFEPANEPNVEWYGPYGSTQPFPDYSIPDPWDAMDDYFANLYDYVQQHRGSLMVRVFTSPMGQVAYAEERNILSNSTRAKNFLSRDMP
jgi:hypothetical protein